METVRKSILFLLCTIIVSINLTGLFLQAQTSEKIWNGNSKSEGSVLAMGNGKMLVYEDGPNILKIYPGPYSTPSLFKLDLIGNSNSESCSTR
jgi:hypothetical protein